MFNSSHEDYLSRTNLQRGLLLALVIACGYFIPNNYIVFPLHQVVLTRVDGWVALQPAWIWFYISYYLLLVWAYFYTTATLAQRIYFGAMSLAAGVGFVVFFFFPTMISRDLYPWTGAITLSSKMLEHIRGADYPVNCLPSMHICMSFIAASCISLVAARTGRILVWLWFFGIAYSTMATKQHYFVDVVAGFCLGITSVALFLRHFGVLPDVLAWLASADHGRFQLRVNGARRAWVPRAPSRFREALAKLRRRG